MNLKLPKISSLYIDANVVTDEKIISKFVSDFYQKLYSSSFNPDSSDLFFSKIWPVIPCISINNTNLCEEEMSLKELDDIIKKTPFNKSPGPDGLPFEFYRVFWEDIREVILNVFNECAVNGELTESMKQGVITLLPKPKDILHLDNWCPITLLNSDYKLLASLYANRLKPCLEEIVSTTQSGFMKGRIISNNIRLVLDLLDYSDLVNEEALI